MKHISTVTVGAGGTSEVSFSNIPQSFTHLVLIVSAQATTSSVNDIGLKFNSATTGYSSKYTAYAFNSNTSTKPYMYARNLVSYSSYTGSFSSAKIVIPDYKNNFPKQAHFQGGTASENSGGVGWAGGTWSGTAAITSVQLVATDGTTIGAFAQNTVVSLYGMFSGTGGATVS